MAKYIKHRIARGDTIQGIAIRHTGNVEAWKEIVEYNGLKHPYIVDSTREKAKSPEDLLTTGDVLVIPIVKDLLDTNVDSLGVKDKDDIMNLALGKDLALSGEDNPVNIPGGSDGLFSLVADGKGDVAIAKGIRNIEQSIINRLLTRRGSLLSDPEYGSELEAILGSKTTSFTRELVDIEVMNTVARDGRVAEVTRVDSYIEADTYKGEFLITLHALDEMFTLVIEGTEGGIYIR